MAAQPATNKRLLTRFGNKLEQIKAAFREEGLEKLEAKIQDGSQTSNKEKLRRLEEAVGAMETLISQVESTLEKFNQLYDSQAVTSASDTEELDKYSTRAEECLASSVEYVMLLQARIRSIKSGQLLKHEENMTRGNQRPIELPTLPVPKFGGNIWEWDNFWELYNANVHSQDLPELFKFNYLLDALQGEAKDFVRKFQVTKENYSRPLRSCKIDMEPETN